MDERKRIERGKPESESKREALVEQLWERSQEGRKETNRKPSTKNRERKHEKSGWKERGKPKKRKRKGAPKKTHCEGETGRKRKGRNRGQVARTGKEVDERKRIEREKPEGESKREALEEQLRERIKEG